MLQRSGIGARPSPWARRQTSPDRSDSGRATLGGGTAPICPRSRRLFQLQTNRKTAFRRLSGRYARRSFQPERFKNAIAGSAQFPRSVPARGAWLPHSRMRLAAGSSDQRSSRPQCRRLSGCDRFPRIGWCRNSDRNGSGAQTRYRLFDHKLCVHPQSVPGSLTSGYRYE